MRDLCILCPARHLQWSLKTPLGRSWAALLLSCWQRGLGGPSSSSISLWAQPFAGLGPGPFPIQTHYFCLFLSVCDRVEAQCWGKHRGWGPSLASQVSVPHPGCFFGSAATPGPSSQRKPAQRSCRPCLYHQEPRPRAVLGQAQRMRVDRPEGVRLCPPQPTASTYRTKPRIPLPSSSCVPSPAPVLPGVRTAGGRGGCGHGRPGP